MEVIEGNLKGEVICLKLLLGRVILSLIKLYMNFNLALPTTENMPAPSALLYKSSLALLLVLMSAFSSTSWGNFLDGSPIQQAQQWIWAVTFERHPRSNKIWHSKWGMSKPSCLVISEFSLSVWFPQDRQARASQNSARTCLFHEQHGILLKLFHMEPCCLAN